MSFYPRRFDEIVFAKLPGNTQYAIDKVLEFTIKSRRKSAGAEIVEALHGRASSDPARLAPMVWMAIVSGTVDRPFRARGGDYGFLITTADLCCARNRLDIIREIVSAGRPDWMKLPCDDPVKHPLASDSKAELLQALCAYQLANRDPTEASHRSLFEIATEEITSRSRSILEYALDIDPEHPYAVHLRGRHEEGSALLLDVEMSRRIASMSEPINLTPLQEPMRRARARI